MKSIVTQVLVLARLKQQYYYWYQRSFTAANVMLLVLTFTSIANIPVTAEAKKP